MAALSTGRCLLSILVLPCLASGLRLGPPEVGNGEGGSEISMGHFMREAARAERWGPVPVKPASIPAHSVNEYVINWTVKKVDPAAEIDIFFDHGCDSSHHASGQCTFERSDSVKNPGELLVKAPTAPLTAHAFFSVNMKVEVFSLSFEESTSCLVCAPAAMAQNGGAEAGAYGDRQAHEVAYAQMETRLRNVIAELLQPTIQRTSIIVSDVDGLKSIVGQHTRGLQEVQLGQFKAMEQVSTIASFKEEMGRWDTQRRKHEASIDEKVEAMQQRQEAFRYSLEQKESALHHLHRSVDRLASELNHTQEEQESQRSHFESRIDEQSKKINQFKSEVDVRIAGLELRHNALSDELWGEMTGLAKVVGELEKTNSAFEKLEAAVSELQRGKAEAAQLDKLRAEVQKMVLEANTSVAAMQQTVGNVVNDVWEHFRTASQTIAAHNATFIGEVREQYQTELANAAHLRDEVQEFMSQTESSIAGLDARVAEAAARASALAAEARGEVEELNRRRKRDKTSSDNEFKALKRRLGGVFENSDMVLRGIEHLYGIMQMVLESDLIGCSVELQDSIDRRRIALWGGVSNDDTSLVRTTQTEPQRPRQECRIKSGTAPARTGGSLRGGPGTLSARTSQEPNVRVEPRCLSCSGQAPLVLSAFKMACLQYAPSPVEHDGDQHERDELLRRRQGLLQGAHGALLEGPLSTRGGAATGAAPASEAPAHEAMAEDRPVGDSMPLSEYAVAEAKYQQGSRGNTTVRLPNLSVATASPAVPTPRSVTVR